MKKISFYTLGCRLNQSETAVMEQTFLDTDYQTVRFDHPSDIAVINTCTVTENGDADTRRLVNRAVRLNPKVKIALVGCQAQIRKDQLLSLPNVHWVIGNARKMDIRSILTATTEDSSPQVITPAIPRQSFTVPNTGLDSRKTRANLKIQDGCDFFCSFCEIPFARGRARSREFSDILKESQKLVEAGHQEIVITGINVGTYQFKNHRLMDVITALEELDGLRRIRVSSIEPTTVPEDLMTRIAAPNSKLCRYLHVPLQSGHNTILEAMKRKYTLAEFSTFLTEARAAIPEICLGTDIIAGFPGETDSMFECACDYLKDLPVDYFHVFSYSRRSLAPSRHHAAPIPRDVIARRSQILRELSLRKKIRFLQNLVGTQQNVLFEQNKNGLWQGLTDHYARVSLRSDRPLQNQFLPVKIRSLQNEILIGDLLDK